MENMEQYLRPAHFMDSDNADVIAYAYKVVGEEKDPLKQAVLLYYAVRDGFLYNPYNIDLSDEGMKASTMLHKGFGYCGEKANLLAACGRVLSIPSRVGFADVKNHINSQKLMELLRSDILAFHGFTEFYLNGKWVKATPAFNKTLCEKLGVQPLEFNGMEDSVFQENDGPQGQFMEYVKDHGTFADIPRDLFIETMKINYPHLFEDIFAPAEDSKPSAENPHFRM